MSTSNSQMRREISEIAPVVERLLSDGAAEIERAAERLCELDPRVIVTVARGSSDHVATYLKYASELLLGVPVASVGASLASIYRVPLKLDGAACLSVSQSGQSPDIVELARAAARGGAMTLAITNAPDSPLAEASDICLDIRAGTEQSVAATKTFVASAVTGLLLLAAWKRDDDLKAAIRALPSALDRAAGLDWPEFRAALEGRDSLYTLGRGPGFAMSNEAALKFKETCRLHAESYSSAEVMHGPVAIVEEGFPVLALAAADAAEASVADVADAIAGMGGAVFATSTRAARARPLDCVRTGHPLTDPIALIVSVYAMVEAVAQARGIDPDAPRHLKKVTETV